MCDANAAGVLLKWYDRHARDLPWRTPPQGTGPARHTNPYHVWLSEVMLQQTTVAAVRGYFLRFTALWPNIHALASAPQAQVMAEWAGLGYYARARNLHKCAQTIVADHAGQFPSSRDALQSLPGIGPYTAAAIAAIAFDQPVCVVDGNVERVMARLFAVRTPLEKAKKVLRRHAENLTPRHRPGDYAQAVMDLGATVCTPKSPRCKACPWQNNCKGRKLGLEATLPRRTPKKKKPIRHGICYVVRRADGAYLLERRPPKGLLGGMLGWPGSSWGSTAQEQPPLMAHWHDPGIEVRHTFTHFHLRLTMRLAHVPMDAKPDTGNFLGTDEFQPGALPTVMRKVFDAGESGFARIEPKPHRI